MLDYLFEHLVTSWCVTFKRWSLARGSMPLGVNLEGLSTVLSSSSLSASWLPDSRSCYHAFPTITAANPLKLQAQNKPFLH